MCVHAAQQGDHPGDLYALPVHLNGAIGGTGIMQREDAHLRTVVQRAAVIHRAHHRRHRFHIAGRAGDQQRSRFVVIADRKAPIGHAHPLQRRLHLVGGGSGQGQGRAGDFVAAPHAQHRTVVIPDESVAGRQRVQELLRRGSELATDRAADLRRNPGHHPLAGGEVAQDILQILVFDHVLEVAAMPGHLGRRRRSGGGVHRDRQRHCQTRAWHCRRSRTLLFH